MIYADPKTRKAAILLGALPEKAKLFVHVRWDEIRGLNTASLPAKFDADLVGLEPNSNRVELLLRGIPEFATLPVFAPLEDVDSVWLSDQRWAVRLNGAVRYTKAAINIEPKVGYVPGR